MYTTSERRAKPRINCDCQAFVDGIDLEGCEYHDFGTLVNLSAGGLYMLVKNDIGQGSKISITIYLSNTINDLDTPKLATNGVVVRSEPHADGSCGVAVKFHNYRFL